MDLVAYFFGGLCVLSMLLGLWQWLAALRFRLHETPTPGAAFPRLTLLKPLKGCDEHTADNLRSWLAQDYPGHWQILFGVADPNDPVCAVVRRLLGEFPDVQAQLEICQPLLGANAKVSTLVHLQKLTTGELIVISDADVRAPEHLLAQLTPGFADDALGLVNCFYRLANPVNLAMRWEAIAINADFWSQVLQGATLKPLDFALGAVMVARRTALENIGGFEVLLNYLADDYQLGNRIAQAGYRIELARQVVDCVSHPMSWGEVWRHQLRWARTIRFCQPAPWCFSILSNPILWPSLLMMVAPHKSWAWVLALAAAILRVAAAWDLQSRLTGRRDHTPWLWLMPVKDLLAVVLWAASFLGSTVEWRGERFRVKRGGLLTRLD